MLAHDNVEVIPDPKRMQTKAALKKAETEVKEAAALLAAFKVGEDFEDDAVISLSLYEARRCALENYAHALAAYVMCFDEHNRTGGFSE